MALNPWNIFYLPKFELLSPKNHKPNAKKPLYLLIQSIRKLNQLQKPFVGFFVCEMMCRFGEGNTKSL